MVVEAKTKRSLQQIVAERDSKNQCVKCGKQCDKHDPKNRRKRGLCPLHYSRWLEARPDSPRAAAKYDADCIEDGELMPFRGGKNNIGEEDSYKARARKVS